MPYADGGLRRDGEPSGAEVLHRRAPSTLCDFTHDAGRLYEAGEAVAAASGDVPRALRHRDEALPEEYVLEEVAVLRFAVRHPGAGTEVLHQCRQDEADMEGEDKKEKEGGEE